eukprot:11227802-Lingulodinium_polyedra.AAC.1
MRGALPAQNLMAPENASGHQGSTGNQWRIHGESGAGGQAQNPRIDGDAVAERSRIYVGRCNRKSMGRMRAG